MGNLMLNDMQMFFEVAKVSLWRLEIDNVYMVTIVLMN